MKMCGINVISTYIFWIHHEEEEGVFDFSGRKNLRKFIELCQKHNIYVILRIGPFDHGEVRNGGLPDWLYGKSFVVRKLNDRFLYYVKRLYTEIAGQVQGLLYKDGGPVIAAQIDNEYMHSSATWEITTGISDEWIFGGDDGEAYMYALRDLAKECGIVTPFYTCTYNYRFILPYKSIDAMANIKLASGCNFLGYYMFQGGSNPKGKHGTFMNEAQSPKISYDYQAALGEFGQIRESYQRLKSVHSFCRTFAETFCHMQTVLPEGASQIDPSDADTLRFAVRTDGHSGYLFLNNFQDHMETRAKENETIVLHMTGEDITFSGISLAPEENCILPFHMDLNGIDLVTATTQPITVLSDQKEPVFIFLKPEGMNPVFHFEDKAVTDQGDHTYQCCTEKEAELFRVTKLPETDASCPGSTQKKQTIRILCLNRKLADQMYLMSGGYLLFSSGAVMEDADGIRLETTDAENEILTFPKGTASLSSCRADTSVSEDTDNTIFDLWKADTNARQIPVLITQTARTKYELSFPERFMDGLKDALLCVDYTGDIGSAFINGDMINDNFCNHNTWEIGLRTFARRLEKHPLTISITPLREGRNVNVESAMAARMENAEKYTAELINVTVKPVYEIYL